VKKQTINPTKAVSPATREGGYFLKKKIPIPMPGLSYRQSSGLDGNSSTSWRCTPGVSIFIATVRWKNQARTQNETGTRTDAKCHSQFLQYVASRYGMAIPYSYTPIYVSIYISMALRFFLSLPCKSMPNSGTFMPWKARRCDFAKSVFGVFYADLKYYGKPDLKQCGGRVDQ